MLRLYALIIILAVLGGVGYGAFWYYKDTQARIATLRENNAKLEVAVQTAQASVEKMQADVQRLGELNTQLSKDLQKAEEYGDALRGKLAKLDRKRCIKRC
jgi:FtsZ-binding cell division protein ZapB